MELEAHMWPPAVYMMYACAAIFPSQVVDITDTDICLCVVIGKVLERATSYCLSSTRVGTNRVLIKLSLTLQEHWAGTPPGT